MDMQLAGRVAVITGGASGIGLACARAMAEEGAKVVILDRDGAGQEVAKALEAQGHDAVFVQADITSEPQVEAAMRQTMDLYGRLDMLVGCAGISGPVGRTLRDISAEDWDRVMAINVRGNFLAAKHALPLLEESDAASIVFLASDAALVAFEGMTPYCTSKGALLMLAKGLSVDHPAVRVNCLCPGVVDTPMSRADLGRPQGFAGLSLPVMQADQIARHAVFLASPVSAPINGTALVSDFGYVARSSLPPLEFEGAAR
ncbi:SDR family oxidoreductase [Fulvimarina endophytica]|uniref:SDR family oxidoreductase n=1 Tax=Fulvimarina endophytica TaxID=2293836 RepID=A0A371WZ26_9HYPH|nr:SDR family oxidoreductase [Fulvimarina endophytica]RFC62231.1 SDR family oxidoreductase [Fulvimarina endophytica]